MMQCHYLFFPNLSTKSPITFSATCHDITCSATHYDMSSWVQSEITFLSHFKDPMSYGTTRRNPSLFPQKPSALLQPITTPSSQALGLPGSAGQCCPDNSSWRPECRSPAPPPGVSCFLVTTRCHQQLVRWKTFPLPSNVSNPTCFLNP